jgi:hypothetical protein
MKRKIFTIMAIGVLLTTLAASGNSWPASSTVIADSSYDVNIDTGAEYSNGSIGSPYQGLSLWYTWVNASGTQIIFLAYYSHVVNPPIITFLGQHYYTQNNTEVFVGNTLSLMEIYNDTNGNGLPDADYASGESEILYDFMVNSSISFDTTPIERTVKNEVPHYMWGIRYEGIDGFLGIGDYGVGPNVMIDYMDFSYDFYVQDNVSYTKTNFGIGRILNMTTFDSPLNSTVSLEDLSLALFYGTAVVTAKPYVTLVNGTAYNSTTAPPTVQPTDTSEIKIDDAKAYEFVFGQDYTVFQDQQQETHESKCTAVSNQSTGNSLKRFTWIFSNLETVLTTLFPNISSIQTAFSLDYSVSSFLYRVCYPVWSGRKLQHDPTYVAFLKASITSQPNLPMTIIAAVALIGSVFLAIALIDLRKTRSMPRHSDKISPTVLLQHGSS